MSYGSIYVASVALGARDEHTLRVFLEAESYDGPALIIAYSHCIAHGIEMSLGMRDQKAAVESGQWLLYRYDPRRAADGGNPLQLDSPAPRKKVREYFDLEGRFKMLRRGHPADSETIFEEAQHEADARYALFTQLATPGLPIKIGSALMNLTTTYLGLKLRTPLVPSAIAAERKARQPETHGRRGCRGRGAAFPVRGANPCRSLGTGA
ncbi:MAG: hypothetical protein WDN28_01100 [Chthoniobacter sp.]